MDSQDTLTQLQLKLTELSGAFLGTIVEVKQQDLDAPPSQGTSRCHAHTRTLHTRTHTGRARTENPPPTHTQSAPLACEHVHLLVLIDLQEVLQARARDLVAVSKDIDAVREVARDSSCAVATAREEKREW